MTMTPPTMAELRELGQSLSAAWDRWRPELQYRTEAGLVLAMSATAIVAIAIWRFVRWIAPYAAAVLLWAGHALERIPQASAPVVEPEVAEAIQLFEEGYREDLAAIQEEAPKPKRATRPRPSAKNRGFSANA